MSRLLLRPRGWAWPVAVAVTGERIGTAGVAEVTVVGRAGEGPVVDRHVRGEGTGPRPWLADVLLGRGTSMARAVELSGRYPGALVVAVHDGPYCWLRLGTGLSAGAGLVLRSRSRGPVPPWPVWASVVHAWLVAGLCLEELAPATAHLLGRPGTVSLRHVSLQPVA